MFTGIVRGVGRVLESSAAGDDRRLRLDAGTAALPALEPGGSVAVNGCCLTVTQRDGARFAADVSVETLSLTNLGALGPGSSVNLEPSLRIGDPLDGHWLSGHVDGVGRIVETCPAAGSTRLVVELPSALMRYVARKGSIAVDGVSLTVNALSGRRIEVNVIPHTQALTIISGYVPGTAVNIEIDMLARYLERLLPERQPEAGGIDLAFLRKHGYTDDD